MASTRSPSAAALDGLLFDGNSTSAIEELREDLGLQHAVLASLTDLPDSSATRQDIAAVKALIANINRQIAEAERRDNTTAASMGDANGANGFEDNRRNHGTSTPSSNSNSTDSGFGGGAPLGYGAASRKRSIGSSYLDVETLNRGASKSRRATPSPGPGAFGVGLGGFEDTDFDDRSVIDLTGDDDTWRLELKGMKEREERMNRMKVESDRDAALARQLAGRPSPPLGGSRFGQTSQLGQHNAFQRILGRSTPNPQGSSHIKAEPGYIKTERGTSVPDAGFIKSEPSSTLATRPRVPVKNEPSAFAGSSWQSAVPEQHGYHVPGAYVDTDADGEDFGTGGSRQTLGGPSRAPLPSLPSAPTLPSYNNSVSPPAGYGTSDSFRYAANIPAIELARQTSMARQEASPSPLWPPVGPIGQRLQTPLRNLESTFGGHPPLLGQNLPSYGADRPGYIEAGSYYGQPGQPGSASGLAATIGRVNGYNWADRTDGNGLQFNPRLANYLDDYVNDPRKTEEEIKELMSNVRPDMDIPVEERGETPEALRYPLYVHQQLALKWMGQNEGGTNKGGILADDMGLGKTISTLALMVTRPSSDNIKTNLIIGPVALIKQWELEVKKKLKATHKLSVLLLHQKKNIPFSEIKRYDVALTTYGSVASEWKRYHQHIAQRNASAQYNEETDVELAKKCPLLHPLSKFHRIILDEAQCIKNKDTQGSKGVHQINATYRWCLTGTPMMNSVSELFPLIRFLRVRPYCEHKNFQKEFKSLGQRSAVSDYTRDSAMKKLQVVLKAMMLRRMKNSLIDGKPILTLPEKTEHAEQVVFSDDEKQFYQDLETRSQVQFNKYLRAGTVGKNYSNILVLLLRLRQACCHPHLTDFECVGAATTDANKMDDLAKDMEAAVIERIKTIEAFECPICYDAVEDPTLLLPCGHDTCSECFTSLTESSVQNNLRSGNENGSARCPVCRGAVEPTRVINYTAFRKAHMPETLEAEEAAPEEPEEVTDSEDSSSDDDADSDTDSDGGSLADFVVPVDEVDEVDEDDSDDDAKLDAELAAVARAKKENEAKQPKDWLKAAKKSAKKSAKKNKKKNKSQGKGKAKAEAVQPHMLKKLRIDASKNKEARRRYMHYLRDNWEDSAKVTQVIDLLKQIQETDEKTIIFSQWTALLDLIECKIKYDLKIRYCCYTGGMSRNHRDEAVQDFTENPRNKVMLVSLRAGNAGLNLTQASRIIICDPFWNPYIEMQAIDRAHRIGQQREVQVHRILVKETVEDRILDLQEKKRRLVDSALDEGESRNVGRLSARELGYLFGVNSN